MSRYNILWSRVPHMRALKKAGWTHRQIAGEMGLTKDQVKQALARDRRRRRTLAKTGLPPLPQGRPPGPHLGQRVETLADGRVVVYDYYKKENTP